MLSTPRVGFEANTIIHNMVDVDKDTIPMWYALSAPYRKELEAQRLLEKNEVRNYLPMHYRIFTMKSGKKVRKLVPVISNLLFAYTSKTHLQEIKQGVPFLQYRTRPEGGRNVPIIVPDNQMQQFMAVCETHNERLIYLQPDEINLAKGTRVRVIGGPFDGVEGLFVKVKGARSKRVVVLINGITAVATAEIEPEYIEVVNEDSDI